MTILYIICGLLLIGCVALGVMLWGSRRRELQSELRREASESSAAKLSAELSAKNEVVTGLSADYARACSRIEALTQQAQRDKEELEKIQASFRIEFRNLANEILEEKSRQFKTTNKEEMDSILKPFRDSIGEFKDRVEKIYADENQQRGALKNELRNLHELNKRITEETTNLTNALKGNSKVQGDWGEMILETILERSNLIRDIHYKKQLNVKDEAGNNQRPDFVLYMPDGKRLVIDSKVSLTSYVAFTECELEEDRRRHLAAHVRSVRSHVAELGRVGYQQNVAGSPDFVIMFIPTEAAFLAAIQADAEIYNDAYAKQVVISSPTNLTGILMIIHDLWKRDDQSRNAIKIATEGARLYDKFVGFVETMEGVGKGLDNASKSYEKAIKQLSEGPGNLVGRAEKLRLLGVNAAKSMPAKMAASANLPDEEEDAGESLVEG